MVKLKGADEDVGCTSAFDDEDDIAVTDCDLDDDFESWMDQTSVDINDREDYKPFPSKMFALLFFFFGSRSTPSGEYIC